MLTKEHLQKKTTIWNSLTRLNWNRRILFVLNLNSLPSAFNLMIIQFMIAKSTVDPNLITQIDVFRGRYFIAKEFKWYVLGYGLMVNLHILLRLGDIKNEHQSV